MSDDQIQIVWHGIELCRKGCWNEGLRSLALVADNRDEQARLPGLFYSYLGYGIALCEKRVREGLTLCEHAVKVDFYEPENFLNLARVQMIRNNRRAAIRAVRRGLKLDRQHRGLRDFHTRLGIRRSPVLPFLPRNNYINIFLGKLRHRLSGK